MHIIPVIDLLNGIVVHAKKGERHNYQAITSALTSSNQALDIVAALMSVHPFQQLYIADLNAIQKLPNSQDLSQQNNFSVIATIARDYPNLTLWVDAGISNHAEIDLFLPLKVKLILGSENFSIIAQYLAIYHAIGEQSILSLDFMPMGYRGPQELLVNSAYWPKDVIVMSLANVGANQGVNQPLLAQLKAQAHDHFNLYAAGGVRDIADLNTLMALGMHGALVATALHQKQLTSQQLKQLAQ